MAGTIRVSLDLFCEDLEEDGRCYQISDTKTEKKQECGAICCLKCPKGEEYFWKCKNRCQKLNDIAFWMASPPLITLKNISVDSEVTKWVPKEGDK